ncbi:hypothetical protein ACHAWF_009459 [Thalassiosira exigua]
MADLGMPGASTTTSVYNDNCGAVDWSKNVTNKGIKPFNLKENKVREVHAAGDAAVTHIPGEINSSDIFTKEIKAWCRGATSSASPIPSLRKLAARRRPSTRSPSTLTPTAATQLSTTSAMMLTM